MLSHEFLLLPNWKMDQVSSMSPWNDQDALSIDDRLILYIIDTLKFLPTINPTKPADRAGFGLNYHGLTVIDRSGVSKASRIFRHWAGLLEEGPPDLELTGGFEWTEGGDPDDGRYVVWKARRDPLVADLRKLEELARGAESGEAFLLHRGI